MTIPNSLEIRTPRETVNDDSVTILSWLVGNGTHVTVGQRLVEIETSKAAIEVAAEISGRLEIIADAGKEVAVGNVIGLIHAMHTIDGPLANDNGSSSDGVSAHTERLDDATLTQRTLFSVAATALIRERGLKESEFHAFQMVREEDVRRLIGDRPTNGDTSPDGEPRRDQINRIADDPTEAFTLAKLQYQAQKSGGWLKDARASSQHRGRSVLWLAFNYFWRNYLLGILARVSPRGMILSVHRIRGVQIGRDCFVDPTAILETAYPERILIGDDVRIAAGAIIMTHIKAPVLLRQAGAVPPVDKPVELRDHCFIGVNAVVMPGVTVGEGAVVSSGAVVLSDVPPFSIVAGNPAKVVRHLRPSRK